MPTDYEKKAPESEPKCASSPRTAAGEKKDGCIYSEKALLSK